MSDYKLVTIFDRPYSAEKQAEGIAVSEAVASGVCDKCRYLHQCSTDRTFIPPSIAWCMRRKAVIIEDMIRGAL